MNSSVPQQSKIDEAIMRGKGRRKVERGMMKIFDKNLKEEKNQFFVERNFFRAQKVF